MAKNEFNTDEAIAYLITWTSYGTWLSGDGRGWYRRGAGDVQPPNEIFEATAKSRMKEQAFFLSKVDREVVAETVHRHCEIRGWQMHAANPRSNHVHVVVTAPTYSPETVAEQFKAWCTRKLKPAHPQRSRFWTERSSRRWINHEDELESAVIYVMEAQDRKGLDNL